MEPHTFLTGLGSISQLQGLALILCTFALLWYSTFRSQRKANADAAREMKEVYQKVLDQYKTDLAGMSAQHLQAAQEMRVMYDSNVRLVEQVIALGQRFEERGEDLKKLIQNNIQCWQQAIDDIRGNKFCPRVRELGGE